jgi:signal transduction histidine kinase
MGSSAAHLALAAVRRITLAASTEGPLPRVLADRDRIAQVFSNLIGNALKFTPAGGRVTVLAWPANDSVRFAVQDTGTGIAAEDRPRVFDRFWQAAEKARSGTGLGLSIAKAIVEGHGGRIGVDSAPGLGSRFSFCVPLAATTIVVARHPPDEAAKNHPMV